MYKEIVGVIKIVKMGVDSAKGHRELSELLITKIIYKNQIDKNKFDFVTKVML